MAICANDSVAYPEDSFQHMIERSRELHLPYPYLHDETQAVAKAYDAQCTPEIFVFDAAKKLCYHGRVDDNYQDESSIKAHDLRDALEAVLAGEKPGNPMTPCIGCSIKWRR